MLPVKGWRIVLAAVLLATAVSSAQSLGELARQQRAQKRQQAKPGRVYTEDNLPRGARLSTVGPQAEAAPAGAEAASAPTKKPAEKLAPFVPTPEPVVLRMLEMAGVGPDDVVYDLGCGDGRIPILAALKFGARGVGVELDEGLFQEASERVRRLGLEDRVKIIHGDLMEVDLSPATVVTLYLLTSANEKVRPNLEKYLRPGARVVSHDFEMLGWKLGKVETLSGENIGGHTIYLYVR